MSLVSQRVTVLKSQRPDFKVRRLHKLLRASVATLPQLLRLPILKSIIQYQGAFSFLHLCKLEASHFLNYGKQIWTRARKLQVANPANATICLTVNVSSVMFICSFSSHIESIHNHNLHVILGKEYHMPYGTVKYPTLQPF